MQWLDKEGMSLPEATIQHIVGEHYRRLLEDIRKEHLHSDTPHTFEELEELEDSAQNMEASARTFLATTNFESVSPIADLILEQSGHTEVTPDDYREVCIQVARASIQMSDELRKLAGGDATTGVSYFDTHQGSSATSANPSNSILLSDAIEKFIGEKHRAGAWKPKSSAQNRASLEQALAIIGDIPVSALSPTLAQEWKEVMLALPPNMTKDPNFREMSPREAADANTAKTLALETYNNIHRRVNAFTQWLVDNGYTDRNYFQSLSMKEKKRASEQRAAFTDEDLQKLFSTKQYVEHKYLRPHYYWLPLLGLHTGARLGELCQLYLDDFEEIDGHWCMRFTDEREDQSLKSPSSKRVIPVHPKLIELGLREYVSELSNDGEERLFPSLKHERDGYAQAPSKWFARYRKKLDMVDLSPRKDFHSFRHTLATRLKQAGVPEGVAGAIVGHTTGTGITYGRYGKDYLVEQLSEAISSVAFDKPLLHVRRFLPNK